MNLFIFAGVVIFFSIISIAIGVFGYMTLWGVNLDAVSMISLIMSIGFAVDLSAHIIYAFVTSKGDSKQKVVGALETLGWPIFQVFRLFIQEWPEEKNQAP